MNTLPREINKNMNPQAQQIMPLLQQFKNDLQKLYGSQMYSLTLFGSYARGEAQQYSDIDILVLLNEMQSPYTEIRKMGEIKYNFLENNDLVISTIPTSRERFENLEMPLYRNIKKEGIVI